MTEEIRKRLSENLQSIRDRMEAAAVRAARPIDSIKLVAVTKYAQLEWVRELVGLGMLDLGESRPQQLTTRSKELPPEIQWHMIGHLQRNKVEDVLPVAALIHSIDSTRLFEQLAKSAQKLSVRPRILLEVNVSGEASKDGFDPDALRAAWPQFLANSHVTIDGLMTMAPLDHEAEMARPVFRRLRELRAELHDQSNDQHPLRELSMGMSGDFEVGIEEGATLVRIGSSLFEGLGEESH